MTARLRRRLHRLEPAAITGVMSRDVTNFKTYWKSTTFSSVIDPAIYLLAFGVGFGTLVATVEGIDYVYFVGTGMVATAVLFSSVFGAMYGVFVKHRFQHTYDAILAAPVDVEELVTAEVAWLGVRAGLYGVAPLLVSMLFGLDPAPGMLAVPLIGAVTGIGFAGLGVFAAAAVSKIDHFSYIQSAVITPLFLVSGTFFPIDELPRGAHRLEPQPAVSLRRARPRRRGLWPAVGRPRPCRGPRWLRARRLATGGLALREAPDRLGNVESKHGG
jgi:lipooligosaccharide transport system permease protein